ncbi:molybdopterin-dependent oxidoreductase [Adlercreutzia sp. R25]|uniref:Molybdopterin-dependent oxidoreductase n=1 Tax=Adlercreutzia shanghongiae TaxID=3111773 RepID=A0ABU6J0U7_9ACTN|nr:MULTISPECIES: molybdopterin-dependent oxidoreductase [unclassified Adlercreutzia]MEC4271610.1 molybdopterin-dependent oxidoreductase [Adlercreutzia sp. R25]MEC4295751.1 molybdopterin-dependent oxidoreductase [Adlercreutzia sp. R22]
MTTSLTRRNFVKWGTVAAGAAGIAGFTGCATSSESAGDASDAPAASGVKAELAETGNGEWKTAPCKYNCCCGVSRCLLKVYVEDGVPLKIRTDEAEDTIANPQRRACARGHGQISNMTSPARIKYPMKRKNWSPDNPNGDLRGKDEWERISWDDALQYVATEIKKTYDTYGPRSMFGACPDGVFSEDPIVFALYKLGGVVHNNAGTVSFGSWAVADTHMLGGWCASAGPHHLQMRDCELHVLFGCNWMANKAGNHGHFIDQSRKNGGKVIVIDPWLNQTAQALADEWVPILPGGDTALSLAICYQWIQDGTFDQDYLDRYCIGFDANHMPEGVDAKDNFKDYVLGITDNEPKTAEWAEPLCGVPAAKIVELAKEIAGVDKVNFFAGQSTSKIPAGEQFVQVFYTMALMHGGIGTPGHYMGWKGVNEGNVGALAAGSALTPELDLHNPLNPPGTPIYMMYPIPTFDVMEDPDAWDMLEPSESWKNILDGEYGRDCWPTGKRKLDIHQMYYGVVQNSLNQIPNTNAGIEATRKMDFVWGTGVFFDASRQYCDIVLPVCSYWEQGGQAYSAEASTIFWYDAMMEPSYESKNLNEIAELLAEKLGLDPKEVNRASLEERNFRTVAGATITDMSTGEAKPLLTLTQEDIDEFGVEGQPQEGVIPFAELKEAGIYKYPVEEGSFIPEPFAAFIADPEANPLNTATGKFEICCPTLAYMINSVGYSTISPIGKWQIGDPTQGIGAQTDEYPLLLWTPHSLRRAHSLDDNVYSLREAFPQECFMSTVDAEARGIKNGDAVLMTSPHGQVLRPAKVLPTIVPGAVALQDGSWTRIDEETGIDLGGNPNVLQAPASSGGGSQSWTGTLVQVEKYAGPLELVPDRECPLVMPVGIEA